MCFHCDPELVLGSFVGLLRERESNEPPSALPNDFPPEIYAPEVSSSGVHLIPLIRIASVLAGLFFSAFL